MNLIEQWKAYQGPKDERIEVEMNRIYRTGFLMLTGGYVVYLYYSLALGQAQMMADMEATGTGSMTFDLPSMLLFAWFMVVMLCCAARQVRKGFVDDGRFAETDVFPGGYFSLVAGLAAVSAGLLAALVRMLAMFQVGATCDWWLSATLVGSALVGTFVAILVFGSCLLAFYLSFRAAKTRRDKALRSLGGE
ncbi:MAG: hypothetical protein ACLSVD_16880 [Eggerthellaceae bacterium]